MEQMELSSKLADGCRKWICESTPVHVDVIEGAIVGVRVPAQVEFAVVEADPKIKCVCPCLPPPLSRRVERVHCIAPLYPSSAPAPGAAWVSGRASALLVPGTAWHFTGCRSSSSPTYYYRLSGCVRSSVWRAWARRWHGAGPARRTARA
jgi:hypothetical protein